MHTIHPSVIMNISEHYTRTPDGVIIIGALLGKKKEIIDSFELRGLSNTEIDSVYFSSKIELIKQVSPELDLIGWYSTKENLILHEQICKFIPNSIFVRLDPNKRDGLIPLFIYELDGNSTLVETSWTIVTEDIEIIGLDNAKMLHVDVSPSAAIDNLMLQRNAVKMLKDRIKVISRYVKDVQTGKLPPNQEVIADIAKLCNRFPLMNDCLYTEAYNVQCNDVALNTYLGILTKGSMAKVHNGQGIPQIVKNRAFSYGHNRR